MSIGSLYALMILVGCGSSGGSTPPPIPNSYTVTDLGVLPGATTMSANAINNKGQVVGISLGSTSDGFLWDNGTLTSLGHLSTQLGGVIPYAINDNSQIVGQARVPDPNGVVLHFHGFLWQNGQMSDIGTLASQEATAYDINNQGIAVGGSGDANGIVRLVIWSGTQIQDLDPSGTKNSGGFSINDSGVIAGNLDVASSGNPNYHSYIYSNGHFQDIGTLGGPFSVTQAISNSGAVVGQSRTASGEDHGYIYKSGVMTDLGTLGGNFSWAMSVNSFDQVVGTSLIDASNTAHAFLYANSQLIDLNSRLPAGSGWVLETAQGINDRGQIVGAGSHNGQFRAFLLTPSP